MSRDSGPKAPRPDGGKDGEPGDVDAAVEHDAAVADGGDDAAVDAETDSGEEIDAGRCGDGARSHLEGCDDANLTSGDGCDAECRPEMGYRCAGAEASKDVCVAVCGDKRVVGAEACDDGNDVDDDYCSNDCKSAGSCGDGTPQAGAGETCDDGNAVTESCGYAAQSCTVCDASCKLVPGATSYCGDTTIDSAHGEQCDDGDHDPGDGCDADCQVEAVATCGNAVLDAGEECDDHNTKNLDGCNAACKKEAGWNCPTVGSACTSICGDGNKVGSEACDDGNTVTEACAYGQTSCTVCNASCKNQAGAVSFCGDGIVQSGMLEECDAENDQRCAGCKLVCDTVFITYASEGVFEVTDSLSDGKHPQTGGTVVVALPAGASGPSTGKAGVVYLRSPVNFSSGALGTTVTTSIVGTAGTSDNRCLLNTGTLNATSRELSWDTCPYQGGKDWTPAQQQVSAGAGPGCVPYHSTGNLKCSGSFCGTVGLKTGDNAVDDEWDQPMATYTFGTNFKTISGAKIEIPNTTSGRTWMSFTGTETSRTCGLKPSSGCLTPGAQ